jgi:hypothetical protein
MLYTVLPLEHIYKNTSNNSESNQSESKELEYKDISIPHGSITVRREKDHYVIDQIWSTDMKDYLNEDYFPGNTFQI